MRNYFNKSLLPLTILTLFLLASYIDQCSKKPVVVISKQDSTLNLNIKMIQNFNMGFNRLESSLLWMMTILESDIDHYKEKDLNSWMFLRFASVAALEPKFYENYKFGSIYLSIIKDDISGASIIYNKGLQVFPNDYSLLKNASLHFYHEARDYASAFKITQLLKKNYPNKKALMGITTQLEAENGKLKDALSTLDQYQADYPIGTPIGEKIFLKRYALKAEIDLDCLNKSIAKNCSTFDLNNSPYVKSNSVFKAQKEWTPYRRKNLKK